MSLNDTITALGTSIINLVNTRSKTDLSNITTAGENVIKELSGGSSRNIGEIVTSTIPLSDDGLHELDGSTLSDSGVYADFVKCMADNFDEETTLNMNTITFNSVYSRNSHEGDVVTGCNNTLIVLSVTRDGGSNTLYTNISTDGGKTWEPREITGLPSSYVRSELFYDETSNRYYVLAGKSESDNTDSWMYVSDDTITWSKAGNSSLPIYVNYNTRMVKCNDNYYICTKLEDGSGGLFRMSSLDADGVTIMSIDESFGVNNKFTLLSDSLSSKLLLTNGSTLKIYSINSSTDADGVSYYHNDFFVNCPHVINSDFIYGYAKVSNTYYLYQYYSGTLIASTTPGVGESWYEVPFTYNSINFKSKTIFTCDRENKLLFITDATDSSSSNTGYVDRMYPKISSNSRYIHEYDYQASLENNGYCDKFVYNKQNYYAYTDGNNKYYIKYSTPYIGDYIYIKNSNNEFVQFTDNLENNYSITSISSNIITINCDGGTSMTLTRSITDDTNKQSIKLPTAIPSGRHLVSSKNDTNGWWRIYSDGWCEQGGQFTRTTTGILELSLLKEYTDTSYHVQATPLGADSYNTSAAFNAVYVLGKTTSTFKLCEYNNAIASIGYWTWEAKGYVDISEWGTQLYEYITVANDIKTPTKVNLDNIITDLNLKADKDLANISHTAGFRRLVATGNNNASWYKIYAEYDPESGNYLGLWAECGDNYYKGSTLAGTDNNIAFPFVNDDYEFTGTNYSFIAMVNHSTANVTNGYPCYEKYQSRTTTSTVLRVVGAYFGYAWYACGYVQSI